MKRITNLTNAYRQHLRIANSRMQFIDLELMYLDTQTGWFFTLTAPSLVDGLPPFKVENQRLHLGRNILERYKNILGFGIACISSDKGEPLFQDDFTLGRIQLYLLDNDEKEKIHDTYYRSYLYDVI